MEAEGRWLNWSGYCGEGLGRKRGDAGFILSTDGGSEGGCFVVRKGLGLDFLQKSWVRDTDFADNILRDLSP